MDLLIVRHAIADDRETFAATGHPDSERPLTAEGRKKMRDAARGLRAVVPELSIIATSPFVRARQTADLLAEAYEGMDVVEVQALASGGSRTDLLAWLARQRADTVALVGHEPDLGELIGCLVTGTPAAIVTLKKGGACLVGFDTAPAPGGATLQWLLTPKLLRGLAP